MLKSKKSLYFLIPLNIFVWIYFFFELTSFSGTESSKAFISKPQQQITLKTDSNEIFLNDYLDPFLKTAEKKKVLTQEKNTRQRVKVQPTEIPAIEYLGSIVKSETKSSAAVIKINGELVNVTKNQTLEKIKISNYTADTLFVIYAGKKFKYFR